MTFMGGHKFFSAEQQDQKSPPHMEKTAHKEEKSSKKVPIPT